MKTKLLRKLRSISREQITVYSITKTNGCITGMEYGHPGEDYRDLFSWGNTEVDIKEKACKIWLSKNIDFIRNILFNKYVHISNFWKDISNKHESIKSLAFMQKDKL